MCKGLQQELLDVNGNSFEVCTPTHKSILIANATTILDLLNINPIDHKTTVENLKRKNWNGYLLTRNYRAENDVDFKEFKTDLRIMENGGKPNFKSYSTTECRKSLYWTHKIRKAKNYKWI